jgi:hypothetical protein
MRQSSIGHVINGKLEFPPVIVCVQALDVDHAMQRLLNYAPFTNFYDWDFIEQVDYDHFVGGLGTDLPLQEH